MLKHPLAIATDLYELTMAAAYFANRVAARATFDLFVRSLPERRAFLVAAGLEQALEHLENLRFTAEEIGYLRRETVLRHQPDSFFEYLRELRFQGEVWAMPEGTLAFGNEPLLRVSAPIVEAQVVETALLSIVNFQTMIASKAARVVSAAQGRDVIEFGSRRAHGTDAAALAGRAAFIGGCAGTSNVEAGFRFGIPTYGTIAHSWVMAFDDEVEAFQRYSNAFPDATTLLIDTYDTVAAAHKIVAAGMNPTAVRLDSGDLGELSRAVRSILDRGGLVQTRIFASGDLNEWKITELVRSGAPIDAFGVGTQLSTSYDAAALGGVYKLVELELDHDVRGRVKTSKEKATYPGKKQVWRIASREGEYESDVIGLADEEPPAGADALLTCVMRGGKRVGERGGVRDARDRTMSQIRRLPRTLLDLDSALHYPVRFSPGLEQARERVVRRLSGR